MHIETIPKSRSGGHHALDFAAYRVGARFVVPATRFNERERRTKDHRNRQDLVLTTIVTPAKQRVPNWTRDRRDTWIKADAAETYKNSRVAREWIISLPREVSRREANRLAKKMAQAIADRFGCVVDLAVHDGVASDGKPNLHVHLLCSTREIGPGGFERKCVIEWSEDALREHGYPSGAEQINEVRREVAALTNRALHAAGTAKRVTHKSYHEPGLPVLGCGRFKRYGRPRRRLLRGIVDTQARTSRRRQARAVSDATRRARNAERIAADPVNFLRVMMKLNGELDQEGVAATLRPLVARKEVASLAQAVENARVDLRRRLHAKHTEEAGPLGRAQIRGHSRHIETRRVSEGLEQALSVDPSPTDLNDFFDPLPGENDVRERCEQEQRRAEDRRREGGELYRVHRDQVMRDFDALHDRLESRRFREQTSLAEHVRGLARR